MWVAPHLPDLLAEVLALQPALRPSTDLRRSRCCCPVPIAGRWLAARIALRGPICHSGDASRHLGAVLGLPLLGFVILPSTSSNPARPLPVAAVSRPDLRQEAATPPVSFRSCRSYRLQRLSPRRTLWRCCAPLPVLGSPCPVRCPPRPSPNLTPRGDRPGQLVLNTPSFAVARSGGVLRPC
jgi:hypothetical protein